MQDFSFQVSPISKIKKANDRIKELEAQLAEVNTRSVTQVCVENSNVMEYFQQCEKQLAEAQKLILLAKDVIEKAVAMVGHPDNIDYLQESLAAINDSKLIEKNKK